jgi:glycosyltransferase involved in cell wall biosynthesis
MGRSLCWIAHRDPTHPRAGGAEKTIQETCRGLALRGWTVQLIAAGYPGAPPVESVGPLRVVRGSGPIAMHLELPGLLERCRPFDVVVEDLGHVAPFLAEKFVRTPGVVFFRHLHRRTLPGQVGAVAGAILDVTERSYPYLYRRWPLVAPSPSAVSDLRMLGFGASRVHLIPYGVDSEAFYPRALTATPSLIYFSGLRSYKRPDHALLVLNSLREGGLAARLVIVGRGPELARLEGLARTLRISEHVEFTGRLAEADLAALVGRSWLHVQCSTAEGWGLTTWEAAASGVPTVAYRVPGLTDSVIAGVTGTLVEDGNVSALADAAAAILRTREIWTDRAREAVRETSWNTVAEQWDGLLSRTIARD